MGSKTLWVGRDKHRAADVKLYNGDPRNPSGGWSMMFGFTTDEWKQLGGVPIRAGEFKRVRITVEEVRSDGE